jgi:hypothetical protein
LSVYVNNNWGKRHTCPGCVLARSMRLYIVVMKQTPRVEASSNDIQSGIRWTPSTVLMTRLPNPPPSFRMSSTRSPTETDLASLPRRVTIPVHSKPKRRSLDAMKPKACAKSLKLRAAACTSISTSRFPNTSSGCSAYCRLPMVPVCVLINLTVDWWPCND